MSNHCSVVVMWSGVDERAEPHPARAQEILASVDPAGARTGFGSFVEGCAEGVRMRACECVLVFSLNHCDPEGIWTALLQFDWQYPGCLQVLVKPEGDDQYANKPRPATTEGQQ